LSLTGEHFIKEGRVFGGGLHKMEPKQLANLPAAKGFPSMPKNIVVCCDGTDNEIATDSTNVLRLFRMLERDEGQVVFGRMMQPIPAWEPFTPERELLAALGADSSLLPVELYRNGPPHVYVQLASEDAVAALRPDMAALADLGVAANCFAGRGRSWKTRVFYPSAGVPEDAATGSAAGPLAIHLARHGQIGFGEQIEIRQGAEIGRPSVLYAKVTGDQDTIDSVEVAGAALIVAEGRYRITRASAS